MIEKFKVPKIFYDNKRLRKIRLDKGISRAKVFELSGVAAHTLYNIENAKVFPRFDQLHRLLTAYGADHLEWCEVLRIPTFDRTDMISFRARCNEQGTGVNPALDSMFKVFCYEGV